MADLIALLLLVSVVALLVTGIRYLGSPHSAHNKEWERMTPEERQAADDEMSIW